MKNKVPKQWAHPSWLGSVFGAAALIWLPLVLYNGYVYLIVGKTRMFYALTLCALVAAAWLLCQEKGLSAQGWRGTGAGRWWLLGLLVCLGISTLLAEDRAIALWGLPWRKNGYMMLLACAGAFLFLRLTLTQNQVPALMRVLAGTGGVTAVLGWMNFFTLDPMDYYYAMPPQDRYQFLSPVGNTNFFGAYIAFAAAGAAALCLQSTERKARLGWAGVTALLTSALFPAASDGAWAAYAAAVCVLLCGKSCKRDETLGLLAGLCAGVVLGGCGLWLGNLLPTLGQPTGVSALLKQPLVLLAVVLVLAGLILGIRRRPQEFCPARLFRVLTAAAAVVLILLTVLATMGRLPGSLGQMLALRPEWGSSRGYIWAALARYFHEYFTPVQKLLGVGLDGVDAIVNAHYLEYMAAYNAGQSVDEAHNVYLQLLLCGGALGLVCWCGFWAQRIWVAVRQHSLVLAPLVVYCVQAFFSIDMPALLPLAFMLAALSELPQQNEKGAQGVLPAAILLGIFCDFVINLL